MIDRADAIHAILTDVELMLRERLGEIGVDLSHMLAAIGPQGDAIILGEIDPVHLQRMARDLAEYADAALQRRPASEPISLAS